MTIEEFKKAQEQLGYNNQEMADRLGVSLSAVEKWRMGINPVNKTTEALIGILLCASPERIMSLEKAKKLAKYTEKLASGPDWGVDDQDILEWLILQAEKLDGLKRHSVCDCEGCRAIDDI